MAKFLKSVFFDRLCPHGTRRVVKFPVDYFDTEIIPKAVFRQTVFPGAINFRKKIDFKMLPFLAKLPTLIP